MKDYNLSIIVPTYNHLDDAFRPCMERIFKYTDLSDKELIIVANGCTDGTKDYLDSLNNVVVLWDDKPLGYIAAVNKGIEKSCGDYVILLNNDCFLLEQRKDYWIDMLLEPFSKGVKVGASGPFAHCYSEIPGIMLYSGLIMISRKVINKIGLFDEDFYPGFACDLDFCSRINKKGYTCCPSPYGALPTPPTIYEGDIRVISFPVYHPPGATTIPENIEIGKKNLDMIYDKYSTERNKSDISIEPEMSITTTISTYKRYDTTLPLAMMSVAQSSFVPDKFILFDDNDAPLDLRVHPTYKHILSIFDMRKIKWQVVYGRHGQLKNHNLALEISKTNFIHRMDDDNILEHDCLENLVSSMKAGVGAVGGCVFFPGMNKKMPVMASNNIDRIRFNSGNIQWFAFNGNREVDHLYSTFLFNRQVAIDAGGYCMDLSRVAHREESIFSHNIKRKCYKLLVNPNAITWHFSEPEGGIRAFKDHSEYWRQDEEVFSKKLQEWGVKLYDPFFAVLNCGMGDHVQMKMLLPEIRNKYRGKDIIIGACYPEIFEDEKNVKVISIEESYSICGSMGKHADDYNVYKWCAEHNFSAKIIDALRIMYKL